MIGDESVAQTLQVAGGAGDRGARARAIDARRQRVRTIDLAVLGRIRIGRPEQHDERFARCPETRDQHVGRDVREPILLRPVLPCAKRRRRRQVSCRERCGDIGGNCRSARKPQRLIDQERFAAAGHSAHLDAGRPRLANRRDIVSVRLRGREQAVLVQVVAAEALVHVGKRDIVFKTDDAAEARMRQPGFAWIDDIGEIAVIAGIVAGSDGPGVDRCEGGINRMTIGKVDAVSPHGCEARRVCLVDRTIAQAIGHEDDDVVGNSRRGRGDAARLKQSQTYGRCRIPHRLQHYYPRQIEPPI